MSRLLNYFRRNKKVRLATSAGTSIALAAVVSGVLISHIGANTTFTPADFSVTCITNQQGYCTVNHDFNGIVPTLTVTVVGPTSGQPVLPTDANITNTQATQFTARVFTTGGAPYAGSVTLDVAVYAAQTLGTIEDTDIGSGPNGYVTYNGRNGLPDGWISQQGAGSDGYTLTQSPGYSYTIYFTGEQARVYGIRGPKGGVSSVSLDNGPALMVSNYASIAQDSLLYSTNWLASQQHTIRVTLLGQAGFGGGYQISFDRAVLFNLIGWTSGAGGSTTGGVVPTVGATSTPSTVASPTLTASPSSSPTATTSASASPTTSPTPTPTATSTGGGGGGPSSISTCPNTPDAGGNPSNNTFSGHTYNGNNQTIGGSNISFTVGSNTCIEDYNIVGALNLASGVTNVIIVNNKISGNVNPIIQNLTGGGSNITINYNSFGGPGAGWADLLGTGGGNTNVTIDHNSFAGGSSDAIQENCSSTCTNQDISYNRFNNVQGFTVELLYIWHAAKFDYNYVTYSGTLVNHGCTGCNDQVSISPYNKVLGDTTDSQYTNQGTINFDVSYNIAIGNKARGDSGGGGYPACFEAGGSGINYYHNYCQYYQGFCDYRNTNNPAYPNTPWFIDFNTVIGAGGNAGCVQEGTSTGYAQPGYPNVPPTFGANNRFYSESGSYPAPPAWTYSVGAQW